MMSGARPTVNVSAVPGVGMFKKAALSVNRAVDGSGQQLGGAGLTHENVK